MCKNTYLMVIFWSGLMIIGNAVVIYSLDRNILSKEIPQSWMEVFKQHTRSPKNYSRAFNVGLYEAIKRLSTEMILNF